MPPLTRRMLSKRTSDARKFSEAHSPDMAIPLTMKSKVSIRNAAMKELWPHSRPGSRALIARTVISLALCTICVRADERRFGYTYEPETMPRGGTEFEQWITLRTQRSKAVRQQNFNLWEIRESLEYGVTDNYTVELYLNSKSESFRDTVDGTGHSKFSFQGISLENRYMVLNPATHPVGLSLYLEPRFSGDEAEVEQKIILGQRYGDWKWAFNLTHATEWADNLHSTEGELEVSFGIVRDFGPRWSVGLELRDHNELPDYRRWENTALFLGPVISYRHEKWWAVLSVLPQIYGASFADDPDGNRWLELEGHERLNARLIIGIDF